MSPGNHTGFGRRFRPGIADVHPEVQAALAAGAALDPELAAPLVARASLRLRGVFHTAEPLVVMPGPAGVLREIGLRSTVEHRALVVVAGPEGEALAQSLEALDREVIRVAVQPGRTLEPEHLDRFLEGPAVDTVALVHAEAGTGALAPLEALARVVHRRRDVLLYVDASGSLGAAAVETDAWGLDFVLAPSEGGLGLPPGLGFAAVSRRLLARAKRAGGRGQQLDLVAQHAAAVEGRAMAPVDPPLAVALERQLDRILAREGLPARWARHRAMAAAVERWTAGRDIVQLLAAPGRRSPGLSALRLPPGVTAAAVAAELAREGWVTGVGLGADAERVLRIGHLGDAEPGQLEEMLGVLGSVVGG